MSRFHYLSIWIGCVLQCVLAAAIGNPVAAQDEIQECQISAWTVEGVTVYGDADTVLKKMDKYNSSLDIKKHRVYVAIVETEGHAELTLYEINDKGTYDTISWSTKTIGNLMQEIHDEVLKSKGEKCSGQIAKNIVSKAGKESLTKVTVGVPQSAREAVNVSIQKDNFKDKFLRVTIMVLC